MMFIRKQEHSVVRHAIILAGLVFHIEREEIERVHSLTRPLEAPQDCFPIQGFRERRVSASWPLCACGRLSGECLLNKRVT